MERLDKAELADRLAFDSDEHETHATTGGAAAAGAITGGVIGLTSGPVAAAIGAVGGAIIGVAAERLMHTDEEAEPARPTTIDTAPESAPLHTEERNRPAV